MEPFRVHLYVCTQQKAEGVPSCAGANSGTVLELLDREIQRRSLDHEVQLTTCGCLGLCDERPMMVVYPQGIWYRRVQPADVPEIAESLRNGGTPVERLVWNDGAAMKAMAIDHTEKYRAAKASRETEGRDSR